MGKADFYESDYLEDAEIFADLVNGVLYNGEQVVKPEELQERDGELRSASGNGARKAIRDKVRLWNGTVLAVIAVENQTGVDYHMVIRNMLSESMAYDQQWKRKKAEHRRRRKAAQESRSALAEDEFISVGSEPSGHAVHGYLVTVGFIMCSNAKKRDFCLLRQKSRFLQHVPGCVATVLTTACSICF